MKKHISKINVDDINWDEIEDIDFIQQRNKIPCLLTVLNDNEFIPKEYEEYYYVLVDSQNCKQICLTQWTNSSSDLERFILGNCFKTRFDANNNSSSYTGKLKSLYKRIMQETLNKE